MDRKSAYVYYSGATDITGKKLVEELKITGGREKPGKEKTLVIGWGAKTKKRTVLEGKALNHPNEIKANRNKFNTLQRLFTEKDMVAPFVDAGSVMNAIDDKRSPICLPLVGRTNYHQGGKGFWICLTRSHIRDAISEGCQYFQSYIDIKDEYRVHVFGDKILCSQKKVKRGNVEEAYINQHVEKISTIADKNDRKLDQETLKYTLGRMAKENPGVDMIVRSNRKGWKFSHVKTIDKGMEKLAIKALNTIGLDFGAVDCCIDSTGKPWIIEINSGPGLDGTTLKAYVTEFNKVIEDFFKPPKKAEARTFIPHPTQRNDMKLPDTGGKARKKSRLDSDSAKARLDAMRDLLSLVEDADEAESKAIEGMLKRKYTGA